MPNLVGTLAVAVLVVAGCAPQGPPGTGSIVDGFPLGEAANPTPDAATAALAVQALDQRVPGHAAIVGATVYVEDVSLVYGPNAARSGLMRVYVYQLADGSFHAAGVMCSVGGCWPWPVYKGNFGP